MAWRWPGATRQGPHNCPYPCALQLGIKQPHYFATHQPEWSNQHPASRSGQVRSTRYLDIQMRIRPQLWKLTDGSEVTVR